VSSENIAVVRTFVQAFQRDDLDAVAETLDSQVELAEWPDGPEARIYHGRDGVREAVANWRESWERMEVEIAELTEVGDRVLVTLDQRFTGKESGLEMAITSTNVFTVRDSRISRIQLFTNRDAALAAARA